MPRLLIERLGWAHGSLPRETVEPLERAVLESARGVRGRLLLAELLPDGVDPTDYAVVLLAEHRPWREVMAQCPECRWITLKPFGPDHPEYRRVLVRPTKHGFRVVWAGDKGLFHLRLERSASGARRTPRSVSPEAVARARQRRTRQYEAHLKQFYGAVADLLGVPHDDIARLDPLKMRKALRRAMRAPRGSSAESAESATASVPDTDAMTDAQAKALDALREMVAPDEKFDLAAAESRSRVARSIHRDALAKTVFRNELRITGDELQLEPDLPQSLRDRLATMTPEQAAHLGMLLDAHERERRRFNAEIRAEVESRADDVLATADWHEVASEKELEKIYQQELRAHEDAQTARRAIGLWRAVDMSEGRGGARHYLRGALASAQSMASEWLGETSVPAQLVHTLGVEGAAHWLYKQMAQRMSKGELEHAMRTIEDRFKARNDEVLQDAEMILHRGDVIREQIYAMATGEESFLTAPLARRLLQREIATQRRLINGMAGELAFQAALLDAHRRGLADRPIRVVAAHDDADEALHHMQLHGLTPEDDFKLVETRDGKLRAELTASGEQKLTARGRALQRRRERVPDAMLDESWRPTGLNPSVRLTPTQRAAIGHTLTNRRSIWNLPTGTGKSLAAIALAKELLDRGAIQKAVLIVPAGLRENMLAEARKYFHDTDLRVGVAGAISDAAAARHNARYGTGEQRAAVIADPDLDVVIVGMETFVLDGGRDAQALQHELERTNGKMLIVVDEAHKVFSPGAQQSKRTKRLLELAKQFNENTHVVAMTGTPIRTAASNLYGVAQFVSGSDDISEQNIYSREFLSLYHDAVENPTAPMKAQHDAALQEHIRPFLVRGDPPPVDAQLEQVPQRYRLSPYQQRAFEQLYREYEAMGADEKKRTAIAMRAYTTIANAPIEHNPALQALHSIVDRHTQNGMNAVTVFCNYISEMNHVIRSFRPGEAIGYHGGLSYNDRAAVRRAVNERAILPGVRVRVTLDDGTQAEGVCQAWDGRTGQLVTDDGRAVAFTADNAPESMLRVLVATSAGATGLEFKDGSDTVVHYGMPINEAERQQRVGRVYRMGQRAAHVTEYDLRYEIPQSWERLLRHALQRTAMDAIDEPDPAVVRETLERAVPYTAA